MSGQVASQRSTVLGGASAPWCLFKLSHMPDGWSLQQCSEETKGLSIKEKYLELTAVIGRLPDAALQPASHSIDKGKVTQAQIQHEKIYLNCFMKLHCEYTSCVILDKCVCQMTPCKPKCKSSVNSLIQLIASLLHK